MTTILNFPAMPKIVAFDAPNRVRELRAERGLSLKQVVERMDDVLSLNQVSRIERGMSQLTHQTARSLAAALDVLPADLYLREEGGLTAAERELVETYRDLPAPMRTSFDALRESHQQYRSGPQVVDMEVRKRG